jgi:hypothetical protein
VVLFPNIVWENEVRRHTVHTNINTPVVTQCKRIVF